MREARPIPAVANRVNLRSFGDDLEKQNWSDFRKLVPHYETFWQMHVYPLRVPGSIWLRDGLDPQFESLAIANYSTFAALCRARRKIFIQHEHYKHVEELYSYLQRACEIAVKAVARFEDLFLSVMNAESGVNAHELTIFIATRLDQYRNRLHEPLMATPKDLNGHRLIPKWEFLQKYTNWTKVMYHYEEADFVRADIQLKSDFGAACSRIENIWKTMCEASGPMLSRKPYSERRALGKNEHEASTGAPFSISGDFFRPPKKR
jgi:hypothetical protein